MKQAPHNPMIGKEILNYRIASQIGSGGMGSVYLADHKLLSDQKVAIKVINDQMANDFTRSLIEEEAHRLSKLHHSNIVSFLDYHIDEQGNIYLIMEYAEGTSLDDYINKINGLIVEERICGLFEPILDGVGYAHKKGVLHRDIKPANIIISSDGSAKILDFGIAKLINDSTSEGDEMVMGTPSYMSPEQVKGEHLDERSDIYSLGVLLHQMLTGNAPYDTTTLTEPLILQKVVEEPLPRMRTYYKYISDKVQKVVDKATAKNPADRYRSCEEFKKALHRAIYPWKPALWMKVAAASAVVVLGVGGYFVWNYLHLKVTYYKDYVEHWGVPEGIGRLSSNDMEHRESSYCIESRKGRVLRLALVNSAGKVVDHTDSEHMNSRYSEVLYHYTDEGKIDYAEVFDSNGRMLFKMDYDENLKTVTFRLNDEYGTEMNFTANANDRHRATSIFDERSRISRHLLTFDNEGLLTQCNYAGFQNIPACDKDKIYGLRYAYDAKGRKTEETFIGADGNITSNSNGLAIITYTYDDNDDWTSVSYLNSERGASHDGNACAYVVLEYDEYGNRTKELYSTLDGTPCLRTDINVAGFAYAYNEHGHRIRQTCIGTDGAPSYCSYGFVSIVDSCNDDGFRVRHTYLDEDDHPVPFIDNENDMGGYASVTYVPDEKGSPLEMSYYDDNGDPVELVNGVFRNVYTYDDLGNELSCAYFDKENRPFDVNGLFHKECYEYDEFGRCTRIYHLDTNGRLATFDGIISDMRFEYNRQGALTKRAFYDTEGALTNNDDHYAWFTIAYDDLGYQKEQRFFDANGKPCMISDGYSWQEFVYDPETNFQTTVNSYNAANRLIRADHREYDARGNVVKMYTLDYNGKLEEGTVVNCFEYDENNRWTTNWTTDFSGKTVNDVGKNYARERREYDERGNCTVRTFWTTADRPAVDDQRTHRRVWEYDVMNRVVCERNFGIDGKPLSGVDVNPEAHTKYDQWGNLAEISCYDGYGNPRLSSDGFFAQRAVYDRHRNIVAVDYVDTEGNLTMSKANKFARQENTYDDYGRIIEAKYYNASRTCIRIEQSTYNEKGRLAEVRYCDGNGKAANNLYDLFARYTIEYEEDGVTPVKNFFYDASGSMICYSLWDEGTGDWGDIILTGASSAASSSSASVAYSSSWQNTVREWAAACPASIEDGIIIQSITYTNTSVKLTLKLRDISIYDTSSYNLDDFRSSAAQIKSSFREEWGLPASVSLTMVVTDKANRQMCTL